MDTSEPSVEMFVRIRLFAFLVETKQMCLYMKKRKGKNEGISHSRFCVDISLDVRRTNDN